MRALHALDKITLELPIEKRTGRGSLVYLNLPESETWIHLGILK
jgi:hypothetical protein